MFRAKSYYNQKAVDGLLKEYDTITNGCYNLYTIDGSLLDNHIITGENCKTAIIKEVYKNCASSVYTITMYHKIPQKYQTVIDLLESGEEEKARKLFFR